MANGTISMEDGRGSMALDSNEVRRKQKIHPNPLSNTQNHQPKLTNPRSSTSGDLGIPQQFLSNVSQSRPMVQDSVPSSSQYGLGPISPKSPNKSTPARKLQQALFEESLQLEAKERIGSLPSEAFGLENPLPRQSNFKPKPGQNQSKPKPKNWASLLQSQSPFMDMKLDFFLDLQRKKEAVVEIDIKLMEVGKWNR
ncbi:hypothetical protein RHMOL_Rhmol04G0157700 [Rhododendron molle]|uniref:Uncharacterized protein n=1 Tax=Rhododendron molle TaxID=49168 RepID=A0ACC0P2Q2_RHOML|nr:hypothetical protein RHMOL_Rhmol04G0157700 [Rhododendron molle]